MPDAFVQDGGFVVAPQKGAKCIAASVWKKRKTASGRVWVPRPRGEGERRSDRGSESPLCLRTVHRSPSKQLKAPPSALRPTAESKASNHHRACKNENRSANQISKSLAPSRRREGFADVLRRVTRRVAFKNFTHSVGATSQRRCDTF